MAERALDMRSRFPGIMEMEMRDGVKQPAGWSFPVGTGGIEFQFGSPW